MMRDSFRKRCDRLMHDVECRGLLPESPGRLKQFVAAIVGLVGSIALVATAPQPLHARQPALCNDIRKAVNSGMTLEQIQRQFETDEATVFKCVQPKARKRKTKSANKPSQSQPAVRAKPRSDPSAVRTSPAGQAAKSGAGPPAHHHAKGGQR